jgi:hypothetical protein
MKWIATLLLLQIPTLAYAAESVGQTPPRHSDESGAHQMTEHKHRMTREGQSSRPQRDQGDSADDSTSPDPAEPDGAQGSQHAPHTGSTPPNSDQGI